MTQEGKVLIDPFSFFSGNPTTIEKPKPKVVLPDPPVPTVMVKLAQPGVKRVLTDTHDVVEPGAKRVLTNTHVVESGVKRVCERIPGIAAVSREVSGTCVELWVEKYKPRCLGDLVGNGGSIGKLSSWLKGWKFGSGAALLSGPPGIGKTSTAKLVCEMAGFGVLEFNASDTRSKLSIDEMASGLSTNCVLGRGALSSRVAIVMDEVDGMSAGDRGGGAALIQMIKKSKLPIICICNDRQDAKIRSLANYCLDLRFLKPSVEEIASRILVVAKAENVLLTRSEAIGMAEAAGGDLRQVINNFQLGRLGVAVTAKDVALGPFEVVKNLLTSSVARTMSFQKRLELFFLDYDLIPLLVQQNYPKCVENVTDPRVWTALCKAAEYVSCADVLGRAIHTDAHWNLLPEFGILSTVGPTFACNNNLGYPEFPAWLGKQSTTNKNFRLMKDLRNMVGTVSSITSRNLKLCGYSKVLYSSVMAPLQAGNIQETIQLIDKIGVPKDSLFEVLSESRFPWQPDLYSAIDSKTKSALTRAYNAKEHLVKAGNVSGITSKRTSKNIDSNEEELVDSEPDVSSLIKVAKKKKR